MQRAIERWSDRLIDRNDFSSMPRLLLRMRRLDAIAVEIPMILRYDQKPGGSKMRVGDNVTANLKLIVQEMREGVGRWRDRLPGPVEQGIIQSLDDHVLLSKPSRDQSKPRWIISYTQENKSTSLASCAGTHRKQCCSRPRTI